MNFLDDDLSLNDCFTEAKFDELLKYMTKYEVEYPIYIIERKIKMIKIKPNRRYGIVDHCPPDCGGSKNDEYGYLYACPMCKKAFYENKPNFCDNCGQAIDWE